MDDPLPTSFSTKEAAVDNTPDNRGRSSSRKRQLSSTSADLMKPHQSRQRSLSVTRQSVKSSGPLSNQLKEHVKSSIASVEARYEKFRNVTNNTATFIADNKKLKADNLKLIHEVSLLNGNI